MRNLPIDMSTSGRVIINQYHQVPTYRNVYVVGDCANLPHAPSAQLAELQGEQIAEVLKKQWNNEPLPDKMPEIKSTGLLGSLGDKQGFAYIMDRTVTGRLASILKSGVLGAINIIWLINENLGHLHFPRFLIIITNYDSIEMSFLNKRYSLK